MLLPARRMLCDTAGPSQIEEFLRRASRPKMGKAKAKQSAGQRAIDLTKHLSKFEDMSYEQLLQVACGLHIENALSGGGTSWLPAPRSPAREALGQATRARYSPLAHFSRIHCEMRSRVLQAEAQELPPKAETVQAIGKGFEA